jgi:ribA/ribD-fused uncharacterized protein
LACNLIQHYNVNECAVFWKTKEKFGGLSNFAPFPLEVNGIEIRTSEALYQACRFPNNPEIQKLIIDAKSPMTAKMIAKKYVNFTRKDWHEGSIGPTKNFVMFWCLRLKLMQNYDKFSTELLSTLAYGKDIVEKSKKDNYWGAIPDKLNENILVGQNVLGNQLKYLRDILSTHNNPLDSTLYPPIDNFKLYDEEIRPIMRKKMFLENFMV